MAEDLSTWLTIDEAATAYGVSARTIRRRIHAGQITARQIETPGGPGFEWRVMPPASVEGGQGAPYAAGAPAAVSAGPLIPLSDLERLLAPLAVERDRLVGELAALREAHKAEIGDLQAARLVDKEEIGRLRGLVEAAQSEAERLRAGPASGAERYQVIPEVPQAKSPEPTRTRRNTPPRRGWRWPWQR